MKRNLLKQIRNEWKDNVWLVIELAVVGFSIWALVFFIYAYTKGLFDPRGFDPDDVYSITVKWINEDSPEYLAYGEDSDQNQYTDRLDLLKRLRENPYVEYAAIHSNGLPYNYNFLGTNLSVLNKEDSITYMGNQRKVSADMAAILRYESLTGLTTAELVEALNRGEILISDDQVYSQNGRNPLDLKGEQVIIGGDSTKVFKVADVIRCVRRSDYEPAFRGTIVVPLQEEKRWTSSIAVRVKPGMGKKFEESFKEDKNLRRQRNVYLTDLTSLDDIREGCQRSMDVKVRMYYVVISFLLVTIFLGLLGTFWFRMQQRVSEIAIRKVSGATRRQIFTRIISEGMILLVLALIIASLVGWPLVLNDVFGDMGIKWYVYLIIECVMAVIVAVGIVLSLWYPARKAMNLEPAIAIKTE